MLQGKAYLRRTFFEMIADAIGASDQKQEVQAPRKPKQGEMDTLMKMGIAGR